MKRLLIVLCSALAAVSLSACGGIGGGTNGGDNPGGTVTPSQPEQPSAPQPDKDINGVTFADKRVLEDGDEHILEIDGAVPEGVSVAYDGNKGKTPGTYNATATLTGEGYKTLVLRAKLEIYTNPIEGVSFNDAKFVYTGNAHGVTVSGNLPDGVSVTYKGNSATEAGTYYATATLFGIGYTTLELHAKFEIVKMTEIAASVLNSLVNRPDPWSFIPAGLHNDNMSYSMKPTDDFGGFVQTAVIGKRTIGKQLNVMYDTLGGVETVLGYFDTLGNAIGAVIDVYQDYINKNPDNYRQFTGEAAGFKICVTLTDESNVLLAGNSAVSIEISEDIASGMRYGRIQVTDGFALKYEVKKDYLKAALKGTVGGIGFLRQIEFVRDTREACVTGYMYEHLGAESAALKTSAMIYTDSKRTIIMSDKRETDDLPIMGYEEIYDSKTGEMLGGEVTESLSGGSVVGSFDTLWFPLYKVNGIDSVKAVKKSDVSEEDKQNHKVNLDYIYVNGSENVLECSKTISLTREYDIEMKDVWYIVKSVENGKTKYEKVKSSVPMLFIQTKYFDDFSKDIVSKNKNKTTFETTPYASESVKNELVSTFASMYEAYKTVKELVSYQSIIGYIGTENEFFGQ